MKILILLITLLLSTSAQAQWEQSSGPEGAYFTNITKVNGKLLAEVRGESLYRLDGEGWKKLPATFALDYYPIGKDILLTRYDGIHLSTDEGESWQHVLDLNAAPIISIDGDTAWTIHANALYRSNDAGKTWSEVTHQPSIRSVGAKNGIVLGARDGGPGVMRSVDGGKNFTFSSNGLPDSAIVGPVVTDHGFFYLGTNAGIFISSDEGLTWSRFEQGLIGGVPVGFKKLERAGEFVVMHTDDTTYLATLNGWKILSAVRVPGVIEHESVIYAPRFGTVMTSFFMGDDWTKTTPDLLANTVRHVVAAGHTIMATGAAGIFRTENDGQSWERVSNMTAHLFMSTGSSVFALGRNESGEYVFVRSLNQGDKWESLSVPGHEVLHITALARNTSYVYAGFAHQDMLMNKWLDGGVMRSPDRGRSWEVIDVGLPKQNGVTVPVMALYADEEALVASTIEGVYYSTNAGESWSEANYGGNEVGEYNPIYFQRVGPVIYAASTNSVFRSTDMGADWTEVSRGHDLIMGMGRFMDSLYIIEPELTGHKLWSLHNGVWVDATSSLPAGVDAMCVLEGGLRAYLGTMENGVWVYRKTASVNEEVTSPKVSAFPNPSSDQITLSISEPGITVASIAFYDGLGRLALATSGPLTNGSLTVAVGDLDIGAYTYVLTAGESQFKGRLSIVR